MTDAPNRRSKTITAGVARSPNRAMLRAVGFTDTDFGKPIVGIASGHSTMNPCNAGLGPLAARAEAALREAGAMPQTFGFPTVTDGISMGTEGMKYSLVSREVIADAIETAAQSQFMDGVLCLGGCDKNMPGSLMALLRMNVPGVFCYGGTIRPGNWKGQALTIVSPFEAVGAFTAGKMKQEDFEGIEKNACPSFGACGARHQPARLFPDGQSRSGKRRQRRAVGQSAGQRRETEPAAARHRHAQIHRERHCTRHGDRRLDQRRAALPRDRAHRRRQMVSRRFRARAQAHAGAVRPETFRQVRCHRFPQGRRCAAGAEDVVARGPGARRLRKS